MALRECVLIGVLAGLGAGCVDNSPPPPRVAVPLDARDGLVRGHDPIKPMPGEARAESPDPSAYADPSLPSRAYDDVAMIDQEIPELRAFLAAYDRVGRPVMAVIPAGETTYASDDAMLLQLSEWLRAGGRVTMLAPGSARGSADVIIRVTIDSITAGASTPDTGSTGSAGSRVVAVRLAARAINARDEVLLGQSMVEMPAPIDRQAVNRFTRFMARKLMSDLTQSWETVGRGIAPTGITPPPATGPTP